MDIVRNLVRWSRAPRLLYFMINAIYTSRLCTLVVFACLGMLAWREPWFAGVGVVAYAVDLIARDLYSVDP